MTEQKPLGALDLLNALVTQAEANRKVGRIRPQLEEAAARLRDAGERFACAKGKRDAQVGSARIRLLEVEDEERRLTEAKKKLASYRKDLTAEQQSLADEQIAIATRQIEEKREEANRVFEEVTTEFRQAKEEQDAAAREFSRLEKEVKRLNVLVELKDLSQVHQALRQAEAETPKGQLLTLQEQVQDHTYFAKLTQPQQFAQIMIFIGRYRLLQQYFERDISEEERDPNDRRTLQTTFNLLLELSRKFKPGYCDAFQITYQTDWNAYIARAEEEFFKHSLPDARPYR